jgi:hypothetical protein
MCAVPIVKALVVAVISAIATAAAQEAFKRL